MKTNFIPALIMLCAGFVDCLLAIRNRLSLREFTIELLIVLVVFYVIGIVVRFVLDKFFGTMTIDGTEEDEESEEAVENIDMDAVESEEEEE